MSKHQGYDCEPDQGFDIRKHKHHLICPHCKKRILDEFEFMDSYSDGDGYTTCSNCDGELKYYWDRTTYWSSKKI